MSEKELAQHFVEYLSCYDLYFEVDFYRSVDIVALQGVISASYEVKTTFNFKVLEQAVENAKHFNFSYIAVPIFNDYSFQKVLCKQFGIGFLVYDERRCARMVEEVVKPKLNRHAPNKLLRGCLHDIHKRSKPGTKSGDGEKITAFGVTVDNFKFYISRNPGCTIKDAIEKISHHYVNDQIACTNIASWMRNGVIKGVRRDGRKLYVAD